jgi:hypothetical protein
VGGAAALATGGTAILEGAPIIARTLLKRSQAGKAINAAEEATQAARLAWQTKQAEQQARRAQLEAFRANQAAQKTTARTQVAQAKYDEQVAGRLREQELASEQAMALARRRERDYLQQQAERDALIATNQQTHDAAVQAQAQALTTTRAVPGALAPETPSWVQYQKFRDTAGPQVVDLEDAYQGLQRLRESRMLPSGDLRPFPAQVEASAKALEQEAGGATVAMIHNELKRLSPLTRSSDSTLRGAAKQLYGLYAEALETAPGAGDLIRQANATFRKEMALQDVADWLRPGNGVVRLDRQGRETLNVGTLLTRLEDALQNDSLFRNSFTPAEQAQLRTQLGQVAGTPAMPTRTPRLPREAPAPEAVSVPWTPPPAPFSPPPPVRPTPLQPPAPPPPAPAPVVAGTLPQPPWAMAASGLGGATFLLSQLGVPAEVTGTIAAVGAARVLARQGRWIIANALLDPKRRAWLLRALKEAPQGAARPALAGALLTAAKARQLPARPNVVQMLLASLTPVEKRMMERETRETSTRGRR